MKSHTTVYRCYSEKEFEFLKTHGIEYIIKCRDIRTSAVMWLYERNNEFTQLLDKYKGFMKD